MLASANFCVPVRQLNCAVLGCRTLRFYYAIYNQGEILYNVSRNNKKGKIYRSKTCKTCLHKAECTKNQRGRQIIRGKFHEIMARTDERLANNMKLYKQRQMIVEHPFGTMKRTLGYTHFLLRGIEKVKGEAVMHCFMYNLKRVLNRNQAINSGNQVDLKPTI